MSDIIDPRYQRGKIYKIVGSGMKYYGSTIQTLNTRLNEHKSDYRRWLKGEHNYCKSFDIIAKGDYEIKLVRLYPCNNKPELERKEGKYILKNECINKKVAGRTTKESDKAYREANREKIREIQKTYRETNKDKLKEHKKAYYENNKEKLQEYKKTVIECPCGGTYTRANKAQHEKTQVHKSNV